MGVYFDFGQAILGTTILEVDITSNREWPANVASVANKSVINNRFASGGTLFGESGRG